MSLLNNTDQKVRIDRKDTILFDWYKITVYRDICFNRLRYLDKYMSINCE